MNGAISARSYDDAARTGVNRRTQPRKRAQALMRRRRGFRARPRARRPVPAARRHRPRRPDTAKKPKAARDIGPDRNAGTQQEARGDVPTNLIDVVVKSVVNEASGVNSWEFRRLSSHVVHREISLALCMSKAPPALCR